MKIACATDDGVNYADRHFGDAMYYDLYEMTEDQIQFTERINNPYGESEDEKEEEGHSGDPEKASDMKNLLKNKNVDVMLAKRIGQNILRMKQSFLPVVSKNIIIRESLLELQSRYSEVEYELAKEDRKHIVLNQK